MELIKDILRKERKYNNTELSIVKHIVTVANPKSVINSKYAKKEIKEHIIKHDQLVNEMKELIEENKNGTWFTEETMLSVANQLLKFNGSYSVDYKKYRISIDNREENNQIGIESKTENCANEKVELDYKEVSNEKTSIQDSPMYTELKKYRINKSWEEKVKPYFLYNNAQLETIVTLKPKH